MVNLNLSNIKRTNKSGIVQKPFLAQTFTKFTCLNNIQIQVKQNKNGRKRNKLKRKRSKTCG